MKTKNKIITGIMFGILIIYLASLTSAFAIKSVTSSPNEVVPGDSVRISLDIKNNLEDDFVNVKVSLDLTGLPFAPYKSSSEQTISDFESDDTKSIEFDLLVSSDAKAGVYKIPVIISANASDRETSFFSVIINSKPVLSLSSENYLIKGKNNDLNIKIVNTGLTDIKFLSITSQDLGLQIISSKYVFIGDISSNDFDTATFQVFVNKAAGNVISLPITLTYRDALNKEYTEEKQVSLRAYSTQEAINLGLIKKSNTGTIIFAIITLVVLYLIYRFVRKRLKKKQEAV